jgi:predicted metal-binding membrane protein
MTDLLIQVVLKRDRWIAVAALCVVVAASWIYVLGGAGMGMPAVEMSSLSMALGPSGGASAATSGGSVDGGIGSAMQAMATPAGWTAGYAVLMFFMWWIMMIAMMLPSAAPTVMLYAVVNRKAAEKKGQTAAPWNALIFMSAYLIAWALFSVIAASLQWAFELTGLLSPTMLNSTSAAFAGIILMLAGLYQLTPLKEACLEHCRGPIGFLTQHWRPGTAGAFRMGLHHGAYCLGCCWGLMVILFFGGIMNLYWIIGLALVVLVEKLAPFGHKIGKPLGVALLAWGSWFLVKAVTF